jgi:hypothetical protein
MNWIVIVETPRGVSVVGPLANAGDACQVAERLQRMSEVISARVDKLRTVSQWLAFDIIGITTSERVVE